MIKMELKKHRVSLPVRNIDDTLQQHNDNQLHYHKHSALLPNTIRCIICGPSNCGKTNVLLSLLEDPNGLKFENVYVYSRSLQQPKYVYLRKVLSMVPDIGCYMFSSNDDVIPPELAKKNSIFIFDDVICDKQNNIKLYFCMGRHKAIDCFYLTQSYTKVPKHLIRENTNFLILFKQDSMNLRHIYDDFSLAIDMTFDEFVDMCRLCWSDKYGFMVIDNDASTVNNGKYRKGFDQFIQVIIKTDVNA